MELSIFELAFVYNVVYRKQPSALELGSLKRVFTFVKAGGLSEVNIALFNASKFPETFKYNFIMPLNIPLPMSPISFPFAFVDEEVFGLLFSARVMLPFMNGKCSVFKCLIRVVIVLDCSTLIMHFTIAFSQPIFEIALVKGFAKVCHSSFSSFEPFTVKYPDVDRAIGVNFGAGTVKVDGVVISQLFGKLVLVGLIHVHGLDRLYLCSFLLR